MLHAIKNNPAIRHNLLPSSTVTAVKITAAQGRNNEKSEITEIAADLTEKLNKLAKRRPFSNLHRVKKYDPL